MRFSFYRIQITILLVFLFITIKLFSIDQVSENLNVNSEIYSNLQLKLSNYELLIFDDKYLNETKKLLDILLKVNSKCTHDLFPNKKGRNRIQQDKDLGIWIKPRFSEFFLWEISAALGLSSYFPPAVPFYHFGRICSLQKHYEVNSPFWFLDNPKYWKMVSLEDYWKGNLATFIFGMDDLHGANIGTTPEGDLYFFDLEGAFARGKPTVLPSTVNKYKSITASFASLTFNWEQFAKPLSSDNARAITSFIESLGKKLAYVESLSEDNDVFFMNSVTVQFSQEHIRSLLASIREKVDLLRSLRIEAGVSFKELYFQLFPFLGAHEKKIEEFGKKLWGRSGFGTAIWGLQWLIHITWKELDPRYLNELTNWVDTLFD